MVELLVVIGIVMILSGLLLPVFQSARLSALQTQGVANMRSLAVATLLYSGDHEDVAPVVYAALDDLSPAVSHFIAVPPRWEQGQDEAYYSQVASSWPNSVGSYGSTAALLKSPVSRAWRPVKGNYALAAAGHRHAEVNPAFNGLLNSWPLASASSPSQLPLLTQVNGSVNIVGYARSNPRLFCLTPGPCLFVPESVDCSPTKPGTMSSLIPQVEASQWVHRQGQIVAFSDTSVKWRPMRSPPNAPSDVRTSFWSRFSEDGMSQTEWRESKGCHPVLFRPSFDFVDFADSYESPPLYF